MTRPSSLILNTHHRLLPVCCESHGTFTWHSKSSWTHDDDNDNRNNNDDDNDDDDTLKPKRVRKQKQSYRVATESKQNKTEKKSVWNKCKIHTTRPKPLAPGGSPEA